MITIPLYNYQYFTRGNYSFYNFHQLTSLFTNLQKPFLLASFEFAKFLENPIILT